MIVVKPVIEYMNATVRERGWQPVTMHWALGELYDEYAAAISEGWCPPDAPDGEQHLLEPVIDPETGEQWLRCLHDTWFRLVYDQIEDL